MRTLLLLLLLSCGCGSDPFSYLRVDAEFWAIKGSQYYPSAAAIMQARNPKSESMTDAEKGALRTRFGSVVDSVRIHWNSDLLDEIGKDPIVMEFPGSKIGFQSFGKHIYIDHDPGDLSAKTRMKKLVHELVHVQQFKDHGESLAKFGYAYFKAYYKAGGSDAHKFEEEAYAAEDDRLNQILGEYFVRLQRSDASR